jgi:hypothetical protein
VRPRSYTMQYGENPIYHSIDITQEAHAGV